MNSSICYETGRVHRVILGHLNRLLVRLQVCHAFNDRDGYARASAEFDLAYWAAQKNLRRLRSSERPAA